MYREIPEDRILTFRGTPAFKGWKPFFGEDSTEHPAKMNLNLLRWILETYTKPGQTVLDPMAGTGSTIILAALLGRNGIAVELEPAFCKMIKENILRTRKQSSLRMQGEMICIQGDTRNLDLGSDSDVIIVSPPYANTELDGRSQSDRVRRLVEAGYSPKDYLGGRGRNVMLKPYGLDAVVTSPPFEDSVLARDRKWLSEHHDDESDSSKHKTMRFGKSMRGVDVIVASPPYGNRLADDVVSDGDEARMSYRQAVERVDAVVVSPPYGESLKHRGQDYDAVRQKLRDQGYSEQYLKDSWSQPHQCQKWAEEAYGSDKENIGNLKGEKYQDAMSKVYASCYKALRPGGPLILVVKNFVRDKEVVRLDQITVRLCERVGFTLSDHWYFKVPIKSFWKILYEQKWDEEKEGRPCPIIGYEDVLVFVKEDR